MVRHLLNPCPLIFASCLAAWTAAAASADDQLLAGVASADITPEPGLLLWGYSNRTHGATGTLDPLMAKAVVLRCGKTSVAIVSLDLGRTPEDQLLAELRDRTLAKCGVGNLFIAASHTHHAPTLESTDGPNAYGPKVTAAIEKIILQAAENLAPVKIGVGRGTADFAHNRRKFLPDGRVAMQWRNAERAGTEPVDREYLVVRLDRQDGTPLAVLFNYACHPVVMGGDNYQYSADWVGGACNMVQQRLNTTCLFLQGGCGNINPYVDKTPLTQGGVEEMRKMGAGVGQLILATARQIKAAAPAKPSLKFEFRQVPIRLRWDVHSPQVKSVLSQAYGRRFDHYLAKVLTGDAVQAALTTVLINDSVALVGMPGEMFVQFQMDLKARSSLRDTMLVGYTNGYHAYFPTIRDAAAGGYGGKTATYVAPGSGELLTNEGLVTLYRLLGKLHDVPRVEDFQLIEWDEIKGKSASK